MSALHHPLHVPSPPDDLMGRRSHEHTHPRTGACPAPDAAAPPRKRRRGRPQKPQHEWSGISRDALVRVCAAARLSIDVIAERLRLSAATVEGVLAGTQTLDG